MTEPVDSPPCTLCTRRSVLIGAAAAAITVGCARGSAEKAPVRIPLSDIPVGGARVYPQLGVVVIQPNACDIRAFSATCPHQGCTVGHLRDGAIECPCHGSRFSATDGSVVRGPARRPLAPLAVTVQAADIVIR
jgi:Rieske Fe-S protein